VKTMSILVSHHQNADQNRDIKIASWSFDNVTVQVFGNDSNKSQFDSGGN
jgi:hypothetical protein